MTDIVKGLSEIIPFLAPYPPWVKWLIAFWIVSTAACTAALILARPEIATVAKEEGAGAVKGGSHWLVVKGVEIFDREWNDAGVQVSAKINRNEFVYPSLEGVEWLQTGPDMSSQTFKLPKGTRYEIRFSMLAKDPSDAGRPIGKFVSQETVHLDVAEVPFEGSYRVYQVGTEGFRSGAVTASIQFAVSDRPNATFGAE